MQHPHTSIHARRRRTAFALCLLPLLLTLTPPLPDARAAHAAEAAQKEQRQQPPPPAQDDHAHHRPKPAPERFLRTVASYTPPDVMLVGMNGEKVALASALGGDEPIMLQFIFTTCPTICPVMSATFAAAQDRLAAGSEKVRMISISIDPEQDTPPRLREYARKFKAGSRWLFLTGEADDIAAVRKSFDAYGNNKMRHEPLTFLRLSPTAPWVRLDGLMSATQLLAEYKRLNAK
ncbi:MAG TPA: SCO family protein [Pyrinomonadaceae bacterium]|nr:SCO family protein [Pyrinomonadaceae bacterium]